MQQFTKPNLAQDVTYYGYSSRMGITRGMDLPGMFAVLGGRGAGGSLVTTRITGRIDIIARIDTATGELGFG